MINIISVLFVCMFYSLHLSPTTFAITIGFRYLDQRGEYHNTKVGGVSGVSETEQQQFDSLNNNNIVVRVL